MNGPRLFHRQIRVISSSMSDVEIFFLERDTLYRIIPKFHNSKIVFDNIPINQFKEKGIFTCFDHLSALKKLKPDLIQTSDVREITRSLLYKLYTGAKLIYDSHEDYFNQLYEYSGKTLKSFIKAVKFELIEIFFIRFFDGVFCTDEYLIDKYRRPIYGNNEVSLLRNFPPASVIEKRVKKENKNHLELVYIGSVNEYRGVIECADYVEKFNSRHGSKNTLSFFAYSSSNLILEKLVKHGKIYHFPPLDYSELMRILPKYDVGICLWKRIKKFEHNLPIKNFDYMAAALPFITSNFGNLKRYAKVSGGAFCIDPLAYDEFEAAVLELFNVEVRKKKGIAGRDFVKNGANFDNESQRYIKLINSLNCRRENKVDSGN